MVTSRGAGAGQGTPGTGNLLSTPISPAVGHAAVGGALGANGRRRRLPHRCRSVQPGFGAPSLVEKEPVRRRASEFGGSPNVGLSVHRGAATSRCEGECRISQIPPPGFPGSRKSGTSEVRAGGRHTLTVAARARAQGHTPSVRRRRSRVCTRRRCSDRSCIRFRRCSRRPSGRT
jgi:hypothetical protein